tara:strand:+ start:370 stop:591 length:222 start_codon:yes stop_codon:yes gene_type:complete
MKLCREFVRINNDLLEVMKKFKPEYFLTDPNSNRLNQKLIGMWVHHLECDRAIRKDGLILICQTVEEPEWEEI